jgi:hypothetical protein
MRSPFIGSQQGHCVHKRAFARPPLARLAPVLLPALAPAAYAGNLEGRRSTVCDNQRFSVPQ